MIRLPSTHAAITAPLVASNTVFPGIPVGRSLLDGRPFHLSPVFVSDHVLPSTNSIALGGLGSGKSTTAKVRARREILDHGHQYVVIDSFGEENAGEWGALTRSVGGQIIQAGDFTLNPCSEMFPQEVREQLIHSLILAAAPNALDDHATHALQHALNHPKATSLNGLVDALAEPEDGRWPAATLTAWGEKATIALSRYTDGSLRGLFDGQDAALPPTDLPMLSFDFSRLDRNSPAIPALMAAVSCWVEQVWLRQSTAPHRHLVLEEAWQILLSPATAALIQRLLKNSRKAALSLDVVMHTLSDLGEGKAQDLARLIEIAHVGRLGPEEAAAVGALLGLPAWAVARIPSLGPGQAVWKVGPDYVDIIETLLDEEEARLTDTSSRRRTAQQALAAEADPDRDDRAEDGDDGDVLQAVDQETAPVDAPAAPVEPYTDDIEAEWDWDMPPNVIDTRHQDVIQAAMAGHCDQAAQLAAIGEREDITTHGINSDQAVSWLATRARVADLCGSPDQAARLRATVARMGKDIPDREPGAPSPGPSPHASGEPQGRRRGRVWLATAAVAALGITGAVLTQGGDDDRPRPERQEQAAAHHSASASDLAIDGVKVQALAQWSRDGRSVILSATIDPQQRPQFVRIDSADQTAQQEVLPRAEGQPAKPLRMEVKVPVNRRQPVRMSVMIGGPDWKPGTRAPHRTIEFHPDRAPVDADTGAPLAQRDTAPR
ncbi:hypothetical protein BJP40_06020 [Streptomyces sp. CC53]|uniref:hypothetical protein n=1 Tax=Streptomyces sp. CC53 TaxID=1906740 RepID=UPI0008DD3B3B|nr:hypothetical protein [Streptomyces sp. CC53]OII61327.1 hypothetical protein BJP40_06020 [Streptomyces sp. CC53]